MNRYLTLTKSLLYQDKGILQLKKLNKIVMAGVGAGRKNGLHHATCSLAFNIKFFLHMAILANQSKVFSTQSVNPFSQRNEFYILAYFFANSVCILAPW